MTDTTSDQEFYKHLLISFGAHALVILLSFLGGKLMLSVLRSGSTDVEVIRSSIRVDVVGMPKFTVQELKQLEPEVAQPAPVEEPKGVKEEVREAPKEETEDVINKGDLVIQEEGKKKKKASFLNILADYSSKKVDAKKEKKGSKQGTSDKNLDSLVIEGNRLSKGSALTGEYTDQELSEFESYVQNLPTHVRRHWTLPQFLRDRADLKCRIRIHLSATGQLVAAELVQSSGDAEYDARAEKAVRASDPFPVPAEGAKKRLTSSGIILKFPL